MLPATSRDRSSTRTPSSGPLAARVELSRAASAHPNSMTGLISCSAFIRPSASLTWSSRKRFESIALERDAALPAIGERQRLPVAARVAGEGADHREVLLDDGRGLERGLALAELADDQVAAAAPHHLESLVERARMAGEFHHDVGAAPVGQLAHDGPRAPRARGALDRDRGRRAERLAEVEPRVRGADEDHLARARPPTRPRRRGARAGPTPCTATLSCAWIAAEARDRVHHRAEGAAAQARDRLDRLSGTRKRPDCGRT